MEREYPRRNILRYAVGGGLLLTGIGLQSCGNGLQGTTFPTHTAEVPLITEPSTDAKMLVVQEITALPDSAIKRLLTERVTPYFVTTTPFMSNIEGFSFPVHRVGATLKLINEPNVRGKYNGREGNPPPEHRLLSPLRLDVPLVGVVTPQEIAGFKNTTPDGIPIFGLDFTTTEPIYEGIAPHITIEKPNPQIAQQNQKLFEVLTQATAIKEACSFLMENILMQHMHSKMQELGIPTLQSARKTTDNSLHQVNLVPQIVNKIHSRNGRWVNGVDATGLIMLFKALGKQELQTLRQYKPYQSIIDNIDTVNLGTSATEVMHNSFEWYIRYPDIGKLPISGNRTIIP